MNIARPNLSPETSRPFRGSHAVAAGILTRGQLRGPHFRRLFPDVYVPVTAKVDLALRARAAGLLVDGRGAVAAMQRPNSGEHPVGPRTNRRTSS